MSAMEDMLVSVMQRLLPPSFIQMLTNPQNLEAIKNEYNKRAQQIEAIQQTQTEILARLDEIRAATVIPSMGEMLAIGEGFIKDVEPLDELMKKDIANGYGSGFIIGEQPYGNDFPNANRGGSGSSSH